MERRFHNLDPNKHMAYLYKKRNQLLVEILALQTEIAFVSNTFKSHKLDCPNGVAVVNTLRINRARYVKAQFSNSGLAYVVDLDNRPIARIQKIQTTSRWLEKLQNMPIRRYIKSIDVGLFRACEINSTQWFSCMVQAMGSPKAKRCQACATDQGPLQECIVLGGDLFPRCGNCLWNNKACQPQADESAPVSLHRILQNCPLWDLSETDVYPSILDLTGLMLCEKMEWKGGDSAIIMEEMRWNRKELKEDVKIEGGLASGSASHGPDEKAQRLEKLRQDHPILDLILSSI